MQDARHAVGFVNMRPASRGAFTSSQLVVQLLVTGSSITPAAGQPLNVTSRIAQRRILNTEDVMFRLLIPIYQLRNLLW